MNALARDQAPDGTPVPVYRVLPARHEATIISNAMSVGATVLELGCGAGRVSRELAERRHHVVAVDQCPNMLQHVVRQANLERVLADIETLDLDRAFDGVVLASYLVNTADRIQRASFLKTCRRHLADGGVVVIQRIDPTLIWTIGATSMYGPVSVTLLAAEFNEHFMKANLEYQFGPQLFQQSIFVEILDDPRFESALAVAGLKMDCWLDDAHTWAVARAAS